MLRWLAAVSINLGKDGIEPHLADILSPVYRELELATTYKGKASRISIVCVLQGVNELTETFIIR